MENKPSQETIADIVVEDPDSKISSVNKARYGYESDCMVI